MTLPTTDRACREPSPPTARRETPDAVPELRYARQPAAEPGAQAEALAPQFGLRSLFFAGLPLAILLAVWTQFGPMVGIGVGFIVLLVTAHVLGAGLGHQLNSAPTEVDQPSTVLRNRWSATAPPMNRSPQEPIRRSPSAGELRWRRGDPTTLARPIAPSQPDGFGDDRSCARGRLAAKAESTDGWRNAPVTRSSVRRQLPPAPRSVSWGRSLVVGVPLGVLAGSGLATASTVPVSWAAWSVACAAGTVFGCVASYGVQGLLAAIRQAREPQDGAFDAGEDAY